MTEAWLLFIKRSENHLEIAVWWLLPVESNWVQKVQGFDATFGRRQVGWEEDGTFAVTAWSAKGISCSRTLSKSNGIARHLRTSLHQQLQHPWRRSELHWNRNLSCRLYSGSLLQAQCRRHFWGPTVVDQIDWRHSGARLAKNQNLLHRSGWFAFNTSGRTQEIVLLRMWLRKVHWWVFVTKNDCYGLPVNERL